ncbi:MAG: ComEC/Rec2 family competence protein [Erythrobacter sp.]
MGHYNLFTGPLSLAAGGCFLSYVAMATDNPPLVPTKGTEQTAYAALQHPWRMAWRLSSIADAFERFLATAGFDRGPWLVIAFGAGIVAWFVLGAPWQWGGALVCGILSALLGLAMGGGDNVRPHLRTAAIGLGLFFAAGTAIIWARSEYVGAPPIDRPSVAWINGYVIAREDQPARERIRLTMAVRDADQGIARKIRVNVPIEQVKVGMLEGAIVRMRVRLMPPAPPMLPGSYNFARAAWFQGLAGTGSMLGEAEVVEPATEDAIIAPIQRWLSHHVRGELGGSAGAIATAFASGDRGGISEADEDAMRDSGLTHLLSISGLHVSAVIAAGYIMALKLLALWPGLALRIRLPVAAAACGALAGIGYTLLTGSEVPTVRSCAAALLVLIALVLGREALSLRMVATAAFVVLLIWPEAIVGPSFQMSFSAVLAIVALHNAEPIRKFLAPREEAWLTWLSRRTAMLLFTGFVIEVALMPIVLFHFHRAGVYGAFANVIAIPLVTFVSMPLIAIALAFDLVGLGAPFWWLVGQSLDLLLWIARTTASQPGAVKLMPQMGDWTFAFFVGGGLWLALWKGRARLLGFVPAAIATVMLLATPVPDVLISSDGRNVGITTPEGDLISLRESRSTYARDNLIELSGVDAEPIPIVEWPDAQCSTEFCVLEIERDGRRWSLLLARNREMIEERALAAACERADIVVADRWLPASCNPQWLKADRNLLEQTGGLALILGSEEIQTVAERQGEHGWWRGD